VPYSKPRQFKVGDAVQTRDGRKARIISDDRKPPNLAILALVGEKEEHIYSYLPDGRVGERDSDWDLVPAPAKRTVWVTWWPVLGERDELTVSASHPHPNWRAGEKPRACIKLEIEDGRFDD
jgi:hypothetical protein